MASKAPQKTLLLSSLTTFYQKNPEIRKVLREVVSGASPISLRLIDYFVTHYSKKKGVLYWNSSSGRIVETHPAGATTNLHKFHLHLEYRAQLKSYTKLHFDPFRRHERISFILETTPELSVIETTVGQLNFFRWAIQNNVLTYIENHLAEVEKSMAEPAASTAAAAASSSSAGAGARVISAGAGASTATAVVGPVVPVIKNKVKAVINQVRAQCHLRFD